MHHSPGSGRTRETVAPKAGRPRVRGSAWGRRIGFWILFCILAFVALLAGLIPTFPDGAREGANETAAIATLRNIASAQDQFRNLAHVDVDQDGKGEFGFFGEMSGATPLRCAGGRGRPLKTPVLSQAFRRVVNGVVTRCGYRFRIFLPDGNGRGCHEGAGAETPVPSDSCWCCYAWPVDGSKGKRTFFVNQRGRVLAAKNAEAAQQGAPVPPPKAGAAFIGAPESDVITGDAAVDRTGRDGRLWSDLDRRSSRIGSSSRSAKVAPSDADRDPARP